MKRLGVLLLLLVVPASFFLAAWQGFTYRQAETQVGILEARQSRLLEKNRRLLTALAELESPLNVVERAKAALGMDWPQQEQVRTLRIVKGRGRE